MFSGPSVRFTETDAWYHLRLVDNLLRHFPAPLTYDPYLTFPGGQVVNVAPGFDWLIAGAALLLGAGTPSPLLVERIAALTPPLLGALLVFPVYALARMLFTARTGLFAAALIAVLPGPLLSRSMLGFVDHHVAEALFSTVALALFVWAAQAPPPRRWMRAVLAGLGLAAYLAMWSGGALLVFALAAAVSTLLLLEHLEDAGDHGRDLVATFVVTALCAAACVALALSRFVFAKYHLLALVGAVAGVIALRTLSSLMRRLHLHRWWYPLVAGVLLAFMAGLLRLAAPDLVRAVAGQIGRLTSPAFTSVGEAMPLWAASPSWPVFLFYSFGLALPLACVALVPTVRVALTRIDFARLVLVVWFIVALAAMLGQVRFGYYLAVPVAVLAGYGCDRILLRWPQRQDASFLLLVLLVFVPNAQLARAQAVQRPQPSNDWHDALTWMREHTPEPLGTPQAYFDSYAGMSQARPYPFPASAYGVLSWWDSGYWILRIGRRIPNTNPTQANFRRAARFFLATDEAAARVRLDELATRYVIASSEMPASSPDAAGNRTGHFWTMTTATGVDARHYVEEFYERDQGGTLKRRLLYYPDYYRTMLTRLYAYGGQAAQPRDSTFVAVYSEETKPSGSQRKILESLEPAASYEDALARVDRLGDGRARIVGVDPLHTSVPLEALETLTPLYGSPTGDARIPETAPAGDTRRLPVVQIFEYRRKGSDND